VSGCLRRRSTVSMDSPHATAPAGPRVPKLTIAVPSKDLTFAVAILPHLTDAALRNALAGRVPIQMRYHDGSDTFYLADADEVVVPLCVAALHIHGQPMHTQLTMHIHPPPSALPPPPASPPSSSAVLERLEVMLTRLQPPPVAMPPTAPSTTVEPHPPRSPPTLVRNSSVTGAIAVTKIQAMFRGRQGRGIAVEKLMLQRARWGEYSWLHDALHDTMHRLNLTRTISCLEKLLPGYISKYELVGGVKKTSAEEEYLHGMAKMSRLATALANERTLLAWVRTVLAIMRTAFAMLGGAAGLELYLTHISDASPLFYSSLSHAYLRCLSSLLLHSMLLSSLTHTGDPDE